MQVWGQLVLQYNSGNPDGMFSTGLELISTPLRHCPLKKALQVMGIVFRVEQPNAFHSSE